MIAEKKSDVDKYEMKLFAQIFKINNESLNSNYGYTTSFIHKP